MIQMAADKYKLVSQDTELIIHIQNQVILKQNQMIEESYTLNSIK